MFSFFAVIPLMEQKNTALSDTYNSYSTVCPPCGVLAEGHEGPETKKETRRAAMKERNDGKKVKRRIRG